MDVTYLYERPAGRALMKLIQKTGLMGTAAWYMNTGLSRIHIPGYIRRQGVDMAPLAGQQYRSFAAFFARTKEVPSFDPSPDALLSPCDGLLSLYPVTDELSIPMKGSVYAVSDLVPDPELERSFRGGLCLVFRLRASDYHHFHCFDEAVLGEHHFIPGQLHSVQPIACRTVPVYRLNRRWWRTLDTAHFGRAVQIEVGAMLVGGVRCEIAQGRLERGQEMGHFELAGSTVLLLLTKPVRERLELLPENLTAMGTGQERAICMGERIGVLRYEDQTGQSR